MYSDKNKYNATIQGTLVIVVVEETRTGIIKTQFCRAVTSTRSLYY